MRNEGGGRRSTRSGMVIRAYLPRVALASDSRLGVAEPSTTGIPSICARRTAVSRPW